MPKFNSLEQPSKELMEKITKELYEHSEVKPRLIFPFPLSEERNEALEMIKTEKIDEEKLLKLLKSNDFIEKKAGFYLLNKINIKFSKEKQEKSLPILEAMSKDEDWYVRQSVAQAMGNSGEKSLPILEAMSKDEDRNVRRSVAQALGNSGEKSLPILGAMSKDKDRDVRQSVAQAMGNSGEKSLPILEAMSKDKDWNVRRSAIQGRIKIIIETKGEKSLPILEAMSKDRDWDVRRAVAQALGNLGEKSLPILEAMSKDKDWDVRQEVAQALGKIQPARNKNKSLLSTRKPLFATLEIKSLMRKIQELQKIADKLKKEFGDKFIGLTIVGSTAKGYSTEESDIDWGIIAKDKIVSEKFRAMAESLNLCHEHYVGVDKNRRISENKDFLFYGLFFGDFNELKKLQKDALERMDEKQWNIIRKNIESNETNLSKAVKKFNILKEEMEKITIFSSLLRVPLSYKKTLELF